MKPQQPRKPLGEAYNALAYLRDLEELHKRINALAISPAVEALATTKADYAAGDVGSAANIATALNAIASALNLNTAAVNQLIAKLNLS